MSFNDMDKITDNELSEVLSEKINKAFDTVTTAPEFGTLLASNWDESTQTQTLSFTKLTATANGTITFPIDITEEQRSALVTADISIEEQGDGYITLKYNVMKPTVDIPVVMIYGTNL